MTSGLVILVFILGSRLPWMPIRPTAEPHSRKAGQRPPPHASLQIVGAKESLREGKTEVANVTPEAITRCLDRKPDLLPSKGFIFLKGQMTATFLRVRQQLCC